MEATTAAKPAMKTGSRQCRPSWSCPCSSASSPSLPSCISCSDWSRADASSSPPSSRSWLVCLWCAERSSTLWWVRKIIPAYITATLTCWPGWLSLSVSSVASFISSWGRKNERGSRGEKRRGSKKTPYHNIALCLLPTDHRLTSQQYNKSACVTNYCKHKKKRHLSLLGIFFFCVFQYPLCCHHMLKNITRICFVSFNKSRVSLHTIPVVTECLENVFRNVLVTCWLLFHTGILQCFHKYIKCDNKDEQSCLIQYKDVHSVCGF